MSTLVIVEHNNKVMHPATGSTLAAALQLEQKVVVLVAGYKCQSVAEQVAKIAGVKEVWLVDHIVYEHPLAETITELVISMVDSFSAILAPATTFGKDVLPRIAAQLGVGQVSDVSRILDQSTFEHPVYAGNAIETIHVLDAIKVLTIRTTAFDSVTAEQNSCVIEHMNAVIKENKTQFIKQESSSTGRPDLGSAKIVVSGGRGLQDKEKFKLIEELADVLNAAVGASRAAVDAGFVPNDYQVGQTGRIVAPALYIAVGISGAVQHLAGMKDSKTIVAINKDEEAPIFQVADYGLVGDLFEVVPQLITQLKKKQAVHQG
ncbi:electron transfer flavoprotein subunit alpha/FixB family protein [Legionella fairfieldensis]|uniref:electron transfer flavoprotein subunit alpha/FixB family protein n=1 Tax=Legionella fairfieldensis TaxID=45064 RepID=UPI00048D4307|nr:FAD-binding protein [Legionella fairfieldensis]